MKLTELFRARDAWDASASNYEKIEIWNPEEGIVVADKNTIKNVVDNILGKSYVIGKQSDVEGFLFIVSFCQYNSNESIEIIVLSEDSIIYGGNECKLETDDMIDIEYLTSLFN